MNIRCLQCNSTDNGKKVTKNLHVQHVTKGSHLLVSLLRHLEELIAIGPQAQRHLDVRKRK